MARYRLKFNKMKNNQRRIIALIKMFKTIESFYLIRIGKYDISLQATFNSVLKEEILNLKFRATGVSKNGYLYFERGNIEITLT